MSAELIWAIRRDIPNIALATLFVAAGLGALAGYRLKRSVRDRALLWFAIFAVMYGIRLLSSTDLIPVAIPAPRRFWLYLISALTYCINVPLTLLIAELFPSWRKLMRVLIWMMAVLALAGLLCDALFGARSLTIVNSVAVLLGLAAFLFSLFRQPERTKEVRVLRGGLIAFGVTVLIANMFGLLNRPIRFDLEPLGLLILLTSLARVLARRMLSREERLAELDKELAVARRIQTSILPSRTPAGPHWEITVRYLPMTAVAGDFYDYLVVDEHRMGILIADVSGHGVPAALIASMVKIAFAAQLNHAHCPDQVLAGVNRTLCGNLQGQFVTAAYLYLDLDTHRMRYAAAGHPALFWRHAGGEVEEVAENGLMLGLFPAAVYTTREDVIDAGDRFLLYTDGLLEAADPAGEFFGSERVKSLLQHTAAEPISTVIDGLLDQVSRWSASAQDDLTLLAIDCRGAA